MTVITTRLGKAKGLTTDDVQSFLGIRYAEPPFGDLRFLPPVAASAWKGTLDATEYPNRPMQPRLLGTMGQETAGALSEDCLFLNITTPSVEGDGRPVMVWIHGGGFAAGSANEYDGRALSRQGDVVVVTINYRLGPFGFLDLSALGDEFLGSGSNGYRDMILALEWVRDNIADYGGDAGNVTLFGESAGGIAVWGLLAAPAAKGLFHKAIAHSPGAPGVPEGDNTPAMAEKLGVERSELAATLRAMSAEDLQGAGLPAGCITDGTVVTCSPEEAIRNHGASGIPLIVGTNRNEGTLFTPPDHENEDLSRYEGSLARAAKGLLKGADPTAYVEGLKVAHPDASPKALSEEISVDNFRRPSIKVTQASTEAGPGGWLYRFDLPTTREYGGKLTGATHACEMAFTYNAFADPDSHVFMIHDRNDPVAINLAQQWSGTLIAFARSGDPNGAGLPRWPRYKDGERACMILDATSRVENDPDSVHRRLWGDA